MTDIYLVITEDRHASTEVTPFTDQGTAIAHAEQEVASNATHPELADEWERELNDAMIADRWIWYCRYGIEGDSVRVVARELRDEGPGKAALRRAQGHHYGVLGGRSLVPLLPLRRRRSPGCAPREYTPRRLLLHHLAGEVPRV